MLILKGVLRTGIFILVLSYSIGSLIHGSNEYDNYVHKVSVVNILPREITVTFQGQRDKILPFDIKVYETETNDTIHLMVQDGSVLLKNEYLENASRFDKLTIMPITEYDTSFCYFTQNVIKNYYKDERRVDDNFTFVYSNSISIKPDKHYVYPGHSDIELLPEELKENEIIGFYFTDCDDIQNEEVISDTVALFMDYKPEEQLKVYNELKDQIEAVDRTVIERNYYINQGGSAVGAVVYVPGSPQYNIWTFINIHDF